MTLVSTVTRPRPLTPTQLTELAADLSDLAKILARPDAPDIIGRIVTAATIGYPQSGFAGGTPGGGQGDGTPLDATEDRIAGFAAESLRRLHKLRADAPILAAILRGWLPDRPVKSDARCGHPLAPGETRCRTVDSDGIPCGSEAVVPICADCPRPLPAGERRKGRCAACRMFLARNGYARSSMARYRSMLDDVVVDGVGHA